jgi:hypothetical protein
MKRDEHETSMITTCTSFLSVLHNLLLGIKFVLIIETRRKEMI